jgi:integrase/recombinase XerD
MMSVRKRSQNPHNGRGETPSRTREFRISGGKSETFRREPLTHEEARRLLDACQTPRERLCIFTLLDTGLRVSEFCSLTRESIDWQSHRLFVRGKGGKLRIVPLSPRVAALLEAHFVLNDSIGMRPRTVEAIVSRVARRAGISKKVSPHVLRHTFAVFALQKGISLPSLQKVMGHRHLQTTAIYLNLSPEEAVREFLEKW